MIEILTYIFAAIGLLGVVGSLAVMFVAWLHADDLDFGDD